MTRSPWRIWHRTDSSCEITIELRYGTPLACALVLLIIHLAGASRATAALLTGNCLILALAAVWTWQMARGLRGSRQLEARWVQVGDLMEEHFAVANSAHLPALWVQVTDHSDLPGYDASVVRAVNAQDEIHWTSPGTPSRRGQFQLGPWSIETGDPLGIFVVRISYPHTQPLLVYPPLVNLPFPSLPRGASPGPSRINRSSPNPTVNAGQVREYERGDPIHHIHWPSTAHRGQPMVKMFDQEASANIWLLVDTDPAVQSGEGDMATEEIQVLVAASLAEALLREGRAVGLITYTPERKAIGMGRNTGHLWTLLGELAQLPAADHRSRPGIPLLRALGEVARSLPSGSNLAIITPSTDPAWVAALAELSWRLITPTAILIDRGPEGHLVTQGLAQLLSVQGITHRTVRAGEMGAVRPAMGKLRRWEWKTLPTGHVVRTGESVR